MRKKEQWVEMGASLSAEASKYAQDATETFAGDMYASMLKMAASHENGKYDVEQLHAKVKKMLGSQASTVHQTLLSKAVEMAREGTPDARVADTLERQLRSRSRDDWIQAISTCMECRMKTFEQAVTFHRFIQSELASIL